MKTLTDAITALKFLKIFALKSSSLDTKFSQEIEAATTVSEILILLLAHHKTTEFLELIQLGIFVTQKSMNEPRASDNTNAWFHIINLKGEAGNKILYQLLSQNIYPDKNALELGEKLTGICTWHKLLVNEDYVDYVITLLQNNILPIPWIITSFERLDEQTNIRTPISMWDFLAHSKKLALLIIPLMDAGILPYKNDLNTCYTDDNTNTYFWLIKNKRFDILNELIMRKYIPSAQGLNTSRTHDNTNAWYWMAKEIAKDPELQKKIIENEMPCPFMMLFACDIYPSIDALNQLCKKHHVNVWHWLEKTPALHPVLTKLTELTLNTETQNLEASEDKNEGFINFNPLFFANSTEETDNLPTCSGKHTI